VATAIICYLIFTVLFVLIFVTTRNLLLDLPWIVLGFFIAVTGAEIPDYDQLPSWHWLEHRSILTHSALIPTILFFLMYILLPSSAFVLMAPYLYYLFLGFASHLFLDLFPVWAGFGHGEIKDPKQRALAKASHLAGIARWMAAGITGRDDLYKKMEGTYQVHLPFAVPEEEEKKRGKKVKMEEKEMRAFSETASRIWYVINGLIIITYAVFSWNAFIRFLPF
jgi:hypothetical protein